MVAVLTDRNSPERRQPKLFEFPVQLPLSIRARRSTCPSSRRSASRSKTPGWIPLKRWGNSLRFSKMFRIKEGAWLPRQKTRDWKWSLIKGDSTRCDQAVFQISSSKVPKTRLDHQYSNPETTTITRRATAARVLCNRCPQLSGRPNSRCARSIQKS